MTFLLIIADDFTGALDTGVQFAACGISTKVVVDPETDLSGDRAQVLVVDTETRHLPAGEARSVVLRLAVRARKTGIPYIYKKTDSALRGNIGAELAAVLEASGEERLPFFPAFPQTGRITRGGIHYVDGIPVTESPFGRDPFEPVQSSVVTELIAGQTGTPATSLPAAFAGSIPGYTDQKGILVFDAETPEDLMETGRALFQTGPVPVMAGCAGFAAALPRLLGLDTGTPCPLPRLDPRLLVVCGSVNPITLAQLDAAEQSGFARLRLTPEQKLSPGYWKTDAGQASLPAIEAMLAEHPRCIIETNDSGGNGPTAAYAKELGLSLEELRIRIASALGELVGSLFTSPALGTLLLTGGDTLLQCMNSVGVRELEPVCELERGVVLARFTYKGCTRHVITKSGGFGNRELLLELADRLC